MTLIPRVGFAQDALQWADRTPSVALAQTPQGSIVGWGSQVVGVDLSSGFTAVAAGYQYSLGLKTDGSIVAWGDNRYGQTSIPAPNTGFVAVAAGGLHSLGLKADGSIVAWGYNGYGLTNVPAPNTGFVAVAAGGDHSLGLKADGSIVAWGRNDYSQTNVPAPNTGFVAVAGGGYHSLAIRRVTGDADGDGDVDLADFGVFANYLLGPFVVPQLAGWQFLDVDTDYDVDLRDFARVQRCFSGDGIAGSPLRAE